MSCPDTWNVMFEFQCDSEDSARRACKKLAVAGFRPEKYYNNIVSVSGHDVPTSWYVQLMTICNDFVMSQHSLVVKRHQNLDQLTIDDLLKEAGDSAND